MTNSLRQLAALAGTTAIALACLTTQPAAAQNAEDLRAELAALRARMAELEKRLEAAEKKQEEPDLKVEAKGAPRLSGKGFKKFKIRGRVQSDFGIVGSPARIGSRTASGGFAPDHGLGTTTEFRRARLGVEGEITHWKYKFEADFANNEVDVTDAYLAYKGLDGVTITVGNQKTPVSLNEQTSSRFIAFMERAAFTDAFGFSRELGITANVHGKNWHWKSGVFSDAGFGGNDENSGVILASRAHYTVLLPDGFLHLGGSVEYRNKGAAHGRFRQRPFLHTTDTRFVNTGEMPVDGNLFTGFEIAAQHGPLTFEGEFGNDRVDLTAPIMPGGKARAGFQGGYATLGWFLTGERKAYSASKGAFGRTKPLHPVNEGGIGAWQLNLGVDWIDLTDKRAAVFGGNQHSFNLGLTWIPIGHVRFLVNYGHVKVAGSPDRVKRAKSGMLTRSFSTNAFGIRGQIDW